jgi:transcriptional regulator of arginine metabolism
MRMTEKGRRQAAILDLVRERRVSTQEELVAALRDAGHEVVQTTVSRDVHELGLVKVRTADGGLAYASAGSPDPGRLRNLGPALRRWGLSAESSGNIVVLQTPRGYAAPLADALDEAAHPSIIGTVAGENTILVVAAEGVSGEALRDELRGHLLEGAA